MSPSSPSRQLEFSNLDICNLILTILTLQAFSLLSMAMFEDKHIPISDGETLLKYQLKKGKKLVDTFPKYCDVHRCQNGRTLCRHVATVLTLASPTSKLAISTPRSLLACSLRVVSASSSLAMVVAFSCLGLELTFRMIRDVSGLNTPQSKIRNIHSVST